MKQTGCCKTFGNPSAVRPAEFRGAKIRDNIVSLNIPPRSVIVLEIQ